MARVARRGRQAFRFAVDSAAVLHLASETSAEWLPRVKVHLDEVLLDHAHCEKKAAGAAIKLLFSYPHHRFLQEPLAELARDELDHFKQILALLDARSCERFQILADGLAEPSLAELYRSLLADEARHHGIYLELAAQLGVRDALDARLLELAQAEAEIVSRPCDWIRLHAG